VFLGRIYVSFRPLIRAEALAVVGGVVALYGSTELCEKLCRVAGGCEYTDLKGVAIPGFVDAHMHPTSLGRDLRQIDLRGCRSVEEVKRRIREALASGRGIVGGWVYARGWDQELFEERRLLTKHDLDEASPRLPAIAIRVCGHLATINSVALEKLGQELLKRFGRLVDVDERGEPTGVIREDAVGFVVSRIVESEGIEELARDLEEAQRHALRHGVVGAGFMSVTLHDLRAVAELCRRGLLRMRMALYLDPEALQALEALEMPLGSLSIGSATIRGLKLFADGSLGARTAYLSSPYADDPQTRGVEALKPSEIASWILRARRLGLDVAIHAIGDAALDNVLKAIEETGFRARIEHLSVVRDDQLEKLAKLRVRGSIQPHFVITDWWVVQRLGRERARWVYRFRDLAELGLELGISTDAPVEPVNPFETLYAAVDRGESLGLEIAELTPDQRLDVVTALDMYTRISSAVCGLHDLGTLEPGKRASFTVLDRDPLEASPEELRRITVLETYVDGVREYP